MAKLDELFIKYDTDKSSLRNNYTHMYELYFQTIRKDVTKILEIGVARGGSVKAWGDYFPNAKIYGIDINPNCLIFAEENKIDINIGDATDSSFIEDFILENGSNFDIIIDDGSHLMTDLLGTFNLLFKHVKSGGFYVFEDLGVCYDVPCFQGFKNKGNFNFMDYLKSLIDDFNEHNLSYLKDFGDFSHYAKNDKSKDIKFMSFGNHITFINKK